MPAPRPIQLDVVFTYQRAAILAIHRALAQSHGDDFATGFVREHQEGIRAAAIRRVCGRSTRDVANEASRLSLAYKPV